MVVYKTGPTNSSEFKKNENAEKTYVIPKHLRAVVLGLMLSLLRLYHVEFKSVSKNKISAMELFSSICIQELWSYYRYFRGLIVEFRVLIVFPTELLVQSL